MKDKKYLIYTDGSSIKLEKNQPKVGAWAYLIIDYDSQEIIKQASGFTKEESDANNMELAAAIEATKNLKPDAHYVIVSDSALVKDVFLKTQEGFSHYYHNKELQKKSLLLADNFLQSDCTHIYCEKIKSHRGDFYNFYVDQLAKKATKDLFHTEEENLISTLPCFHSLVSNISREYYWSAENKIILEQWFEQTKQPVHYKKNPDAETIGKYIKIKHTDTALRQQIKDLALEHKLKLVERNEGRIRLFNWNNTPNQFVDYLIDHPRTPLITNGFAFFDVGVQAAVYLSQKPPTVKYKFKEKLHQAIVAVLDKQNIENHQFIYTEEPKKGQSQKIIF